MRKSPLVPKSRVTECTASALKVKLIIKQRSMFIKCVSLNVWANFSLVHFSKGYSLLLTTTRLSNEENTKRLKCLWCCCHLWPKTLSTLRWSVSLHFPVDTKQLCSWRVALFFLLTVSPAKVKIVPLLCSLTCKASKRWAKNNIWTWQQMSPNRQLLELPYSRRCYPDVSHVES